MCNGIAPLGNARDSASYIQHRTYSTPYEGHQVEALDESARPIYGVLHGEVVRFHGAESRLARTACPNGMSPRRAAFTSPGIRFARDAQSSRRAGAEFSTPGPREKRLPTLARAWHRSEAAWDCGWMPRHEVTVPHDFYFYFIFYLGGYFILFYRFIFIFIFIFGYITFPGAGAAGHQACWILDVSGCFYFILGFISCHCWVEWEENPLSYSPVLHAVCCFALLGHVVLFCIWPNIPRDMA